MPETFTEADFGPPQFTDEDFKPVKTKRTREEVAASIPPSDISNAFVRGALNVLGGPVYDLVHTLKPAGMLNALTLPQPPQPKPFRIDLEGGTISQEPGQVRELPFKSGVPIVK